MKGSLKSSDHVMTTTHVCRPLYLITNMSGREYPRWANHFDPYSPIYSRRERSEILISDCALGLAFSGLYTLAKTFGWLWLAKVR